MTWRYRFKLKLKTNSDLLRIGFAEFLGTFLLVVFGNGSIAQSMLSNQRWGDVHSITLSYGLGCMFGVLASIDVSGGHINPAVTIAMAIMGRVAWSAVPVYIVAQYLGAFAASGCVYGIYYDAFNDYDINRTVMGATGTARIFATYPSTHATMWQLLADQIFGTALLLIGVLAITDKNNTFVSKSLIPIYVGMLVLLIGNSFAYNCGYPINPARDFAPRVFTALLGWGGKVLQYRDYTWFWIPIVGPHVGAVVGALVYHLLIGMHYPDPADMKNRAVIAQENPMYCSKASITSSGFEAPISLSTNL